MRSCLDVVGERIRSLDAGGIKGEFRQERFVLYIPLSMIA